MTAKYVLQTRDQVQNQHDNMLENDKGISNTGISFLWYALVHGDTNGFEGTSSTTVKRLVGTKLFELVPMDKYKRPDRKNAGKFLDDKARYQYRMEGAGDLAELVKASEHKSISEYLNIERAQGVDYFPTFCERIESYFKVQANNAKEEREAKKEKQDEAFASYTAKPANANVERKEYNKLVSDNEKRRKLIETLKELGNADVAELLQEIVDNTDAELSGGVAAPMTASNDGETNGVTIVNTNELD